LLADRSSGHDANALAALVKLNRDVPLGIPHQDGYSFAEDFLSEIGLPDQRDWIDVRAIVKDLGIEVLEDALETDSIRGVALAGSDFSPTILINTTSVYNTSEYGKRFTLAHELCHIIFDRTRARRVTHVSGPWAAPGIERRANAFAAYMLMPRELVVRGWHSQLEGDRAELSAFAERLHVNETALVEHLYNLDLIDEMARERMRAEFKIQ
jgi:Zn-dependent peptidase ImmA (M78 family)